MNLEETGKLFATIAAYHDKFEYGKEKIIAWHHILQEYAFDDCMKAVMDHFKHSTAWIMPAHITERVQEMQDQRLQKFGGFMPLNPADEYGPDCNIAPDYRQKIKALHNLAKHGKITPQQYAAYQAEQLTLEQLHHQAKAITE